MKRRGSCKTEMGFKVIWLVRCPTIQICGIYLGNRHKIVFYTYSPKFLLSLGWYFEPTKLLYFVHDCPQQRCMPCH
jgi:hypothetical protein